MGSNAGNTTVPIVLVQTVDTETTIVYGIRSVLCVVFLCFFVFHSILQVNYFFNMKPVLSLAVLISMSYVHKYNHLWQSPPFTNRGWLAVCITV